MCFNDSASLFPPAVGVWCHDPQRRGFRGHLHTVHEDHDHHQTTSQCRALDRLHPCSTSLHWGFSLRQRASWVCTGMADTFKHHTPPALRQPAPLVTGTSFLFGGHQPALIGGFSVQATSEGIWGCRLDLDKLCGCVWDNGTNFPGWGAKVWFLSISRWLVRGPVLLYHLTDQLVTGVWLTCVCARVCVFVSVPVFWGWVNVTVVRYSRKISKSAPPGFKNHKTRNSRVHTSAKALQSPLNPIKQHQITHTHRSQSPWYAWYFSPRSMNYFMVIKCKIDWVLSPSFVEMHHVVFT